jgi:hypothetical protein
MDRHEGERLNAPGGAGPTLKKETQMKDFMFIYRNPDSTWMERATPEQIKEVMAKWGAWMSALGAKGQLVAGGSPLERGGKRLHMDGVLTDMSASELKELVTGYSIVKAESYEQAAALARECPIFRDPSASVEIRIVAAM